MYRLLSLVFLLVTSGLAALGQSGGVTIRLKKTWVDQYENAVVIKADDFLVDAAHAKPNAPSKDGDLHVAGRANESVFLPIVAEIANARSAPAAMQAIHEAEGTEEALPIEGVWRIWCEHSGISTQDQSKKAPRADGTNPDHVFEIHPVTKVDGKDITKATFKPIQGFRPKDATQAFNHYEAIPCEIKEAGDYVHIRTKMAGYNYVRFAVTDVRGLQELEDGVSAFATIKAADADADEPEYLVKKLRVVAVKGTTAATALRRAATKREAVTVLGIPRISLKLVKYRLEHAGSSEERLDWDLPYEMVIMAVSPTGN